jgi:hypothetical protein
MPKTIEFIDFHDFHRASSPKNKTAIVFVHAITGNVAKTWRLATAGEALMILGGIDKHREAAAQKLNPWQACQMEEQALRVPDLCGLYTVYCEKVTSVYEGAL